MYPPRFGELRRAGTRENGRRTKLEGLHIHGGLEDLLELKTFAWEAKSGSIVTGVEWASDLGGELLEKWPENHGKWPSQSRVCTGSSCGSGRPG